MEVDLKGNCKKKITYNYYYLYLPIIKKKKKKTDAELHVWGGKRECTCILVMPGCSWDAVGSWALFPWFLSS